ncbi:hypothetical protein G6F24_017479 [Rhizopus arrhizus]|nr:hypothetical protein G6F24_017479 [Rhizopus arrhizus]
MARVGLLGGPYGEPALPGPKLSAVYRDPCQPAVDTPAALPDDLVTATLATVEKLRFDDASAGSTPPRAWTWTWKKTGPPPAAWCWIAAAACCIAASSCSSTAKPR